MPDNSSSLANAALLFFRPVNKFRALDEKIFGVASANNGFFLGFLRHARIEKVYFYAPRKTLYDNFVQCAQLERSISPAQCQRITHPASPLLKEAGCLYTPNPGISRLAWARFTARAKDYSVCGITHAISSIDDLSSLAELVTAPAYPWDALICTSQAAKDTVESSFDEYSRYLCSRFSISKIPKRIHLPVIPLGIDTQPFIEISRNRGLREKWRNRLGIGKKDVAVLYFGRKSFLQKSHPMAMYLALERAARITGVRIHLLEVGIYHDKRTKEAFEQGHSELCPSVVVHGLDGSDDVLSREVWSVADIFTSLSDNLQETFGLTPVEAMAAGLPAVVSDWDGYRDSVRHGKDGYCIPTLAPKAGINSDLGVQHFLGVLPLLSFLGVTSTLVSVDIGACTEAYVELVKNAAAREKMGRSAQERAVERFDWKCIVNQYQELWSELGKIRRSARSPQQSGMYPGLGDPFSLFSAFPSSDLHDRCQLSIDATVQDAWKTYVERKGMQLNYHVPQASDHICRDVLHHLETTPCTLGEIWNRWGNQCDSALYNALIWMAKAGIIRVELE